MKKIILTIGILILVANIIFAQELLDGKFIEVNKGEEGGIKYIETTTFDLNKEGEFKKTIDFKDYDGPLDDYLEIIYGKYNIKNNVFIEEYLRYECYKNGELEEEVIYNPTDVYKFEIIVLSQNFLQLEFQDEDGEIFSETYRREN